MTEEELQDKEKRTRLKERLQERWRSLENQAMLKEIVVALRAKQPWAHLLRNLPEAQDADYGYYQGRDLRGVPLAHADLVGADFEDAALDFADLSGANLAGADLTGASLFYADLSLANLRDANFTGGCLMEGINLAGANLSGAEMGFTTIEKADMSNANLTNAYLNSAILISVKMDEAILEGLDIHNTSFREFAPEG